MPATAGWQQHCRKYRLFQETAWEKDFLLFLEILGLSRLFHKVGGAVGISSIWNDADGPCQAQQPPSRDPSQMSQKYLRFTYSQQCQQVGWLINSNIHPLGSTDISQVKSYVNTSKNMNVNWEEVQPQVCKGHHKFNSLDSELPSWAI